MMSQGGLIAFPGQAVRTMRVLEVLPNKMLLKAIKKAVAKYSKTAQQN